MFFELLFRSFFVYNLGMEERRPSGRKIAIVVAVFLLAYLYLMVRSGQMLSRIDILKAAFFFITMRFGRIPPNVIEFVGDIFLCFGGLILWSAFFAQFVLPVRTSRERYSAWDRLVVFMTGQHGIAVRVENGEVRHSREELKRRGPGVIILDTASGAVIRNAASFTQTVGPGIVFTKKEEYLLDAIDLHRQSQPRPPLGPNGDEDPFKPWQKNGQIELSETEEEYKERQNRRLQTSGLTRDGIEVIPNILAAFTLDTPSRKRGEVFVYDEAAVRKAITAGGIRTMDRNENSGSTHVRLFNLPAYLAADVFRETLRKFTFDELFTAPADESTAYQKIVELVQARLTKPQVPALDAFGRPMEGMVESREYKILKDAGLRVVRAVIFNPRFLPEIEERIVNQWRATWMQRALVDRELVERRRGGAARDGKREALRQYARVVTQPFDSRLLELPGPRNTQEAQEQMRIALERLVQGTLRGTVSDSRLYVYLVGGEASLNEILDWIRGWGR